MTKQTTEQLFWGSPRPAILGPVEERLKFAVFIDYDNIEIGVKSTLNRPFDVECVLEGLKERGEIVSKVAYGNWSRQKSVRDGGSDLPVRTGRRSIPSCAPYLATAFFRFRLSS